MVRFRFAPLAALLGVMAVLVMVTAEADARPRVSIGNRGTRTFTAPPPTATAPNAVRPIERTTTQPGPATLATRPVTNPTAAPGSWFNRPGLLGGLAAGFLGAGLIGLLMGNGFLGGLAGIASFFGLLLQVGLVVLVAGLLWSWWQRRSQPAFAGGPGDA